MEVITDQVEIQQLFQEVNALPVWLPQAITGTPIPCDFTYFYFGDMIFFQGDRPTLFVDLSQAGSCEAPIHLMGFLPGSRPGRYRKPVKPLRL